MARHLLTLAVVLLALLPAVAGAQTTSADVLDGDATAGIPIGLPIGEGPPAAEADRPLPAPDQRAIDLGIRPPAADGFEIVGHNPLGARGMNAAIAVHDGYVYVGSRTDGQPQHLTPGILVVDATDPAAPEVVHEITDGLAGDVSHTSRELRIWPQRDLLVVLHFGCSSAIHACLGSEVASTPRFELFDIAGDRAAAPVLVGSYEPPATPHEFFLWVDPLAPDDRALLFWTAPTSSQTSPSLYVTDISELAATGEAATTSWVAEFPPRALPNGEQEDRRLHSISVSTDGRTTHLAFLGAGYLALDTSEVIDRVPVPEITLLTPPDDRATWSNPGAHTSAPIHDTGFTLVTDEVYGELVTPLAGPGQGCPWGWVRILDTRDLARPQVVSEYRLPENDPAFCEQLTAGSAVSAVATAYSAHNPTLTPDLAFVTWHSAGLQAIDISDPLAPTYAGQFKPAALEAVVTEDPALSLGLDRVVMWSYPVIAEGLIYVIDLRNGLYILEYTGPHADQVADIGFLESNSNLGDALRFDPVRPGDGRPGGGRPDDRPGRAQGLAAASLLGVAGVVVGRRRLGTA